MSRVVRVQPPSPAPAPGPGLLFMLRDGEPPDLCSRLVDMWDRAEELAQRRAAGEEIPLREQLDFEREKADILDKVGLDARWIEDEYRKAMARIDELTDQIVIEQAAAGV